MERVAYKTDHGTGWLVVQGDHLVAIVLPGGGVPAFPDGDGGAARRWIEALEAYYEGRASLLPQSGIVSAAGTTPWSARVYEIVSGIKPGSTLTYADVARLADRPGAARAVGAAMARNRFAPFIPCHRVVGTDGTMRGYAGGTELKRALLEMERSHG